jgi:hypothetical protein
MSAAKRRAGAKPATRAKDTDGLSTSLLVRVAPDLLERIDARVEQMKATRPGMSRSDFVREAVIRALAESGRS